MLSGDEMVARAKGLIQKAGSQPDARAIIDLVSTIVVYRFSALTRDKVMDMLGIESVTLQQTRFYQDVLKEGERSLVLKLLTRKLKTVPAKLQERVNGLEIDRLEALGEALLDFNSVADLEKFLDS